jgi:hypothetical protein
VSGTDTEAARTQYRPNSMQKLREAALRMLGEGRSIHTVAAAMNISVEMARRLAFCAECG